MDVPLITDPLFCAAAVPAVLLPPAPIGVVIGVKLARRISPLLFYRCVYAGMLLTGLKLVWDGFVAR